MTMSELKTVSDNSTGLLHSQVSQLESQGWVRIGEQKFDGKLFYQMMRREVTEQEKLSMQREA